MLEDAGEVKFTCGEHAESKAVLTVEINKGTWFKQ